MIFSGQVPSIDCSAVKDTVCAFVRSQLTSLKREGVVVGLSGGVDSALCASLCVEALGRERVSGLLLPERESDPLSTEYALAESRRLGIETEIVDITAT